MAVQHTGAQAGDLSKLPVSLRNPNKVTEAQLALLWADFQRLSACDPTLPEDAIRYAVDGVGSAVIGAVRQATDVGRQLELTACNAHGFILDAGGIARRQLFNDPTLPVIRAQSHAGNLRSRQPYQRAPQDVGLQAAGLAGYSAHGSQRIQARCLDQRRRALPGRGLDCRSAGHCTVGAA